MSRLPLSLRLALRALPRAFRRQWSTEIAAIAARRIEAAARLGHGARRRAVARVLRDTLATTVRLRLGGALRRAALPASDRLSPLDWMHTMLTQDLRFALRALVQRPLFSAVVLLVLGLGLGANAVVYSAVDAIVLNPFSWPEADRVVGIGVEYPRLGRELRFFEAISAPEYADVRDQAGALEHSVAFDLGNRQITGGDMPQNLFSGFWWGDVLPVLELQPEVGRGFTGEDFGQERAVALISTQVWRSRFAADPGVVGRVVQVDGEPYTVIGVFPSSARIYGTDLWLPMWASPELMPRDRRQFNIIGRLREGAGIAQLNAELATVARRTAAEHGAAFEEYEGWRLVAATWADVNQAELRPAAFMLLGSVGFVLLLVCANVGSLLLARSVGRQREMAVRSALGAGRGRILRQLLTESLVLALLGGLLGAGLAWLGVRGVAALVPARMVPAEAGIQLNVRALGYAAALALASGIVFGFAPALTAARTQVRHVLATGGGGTTRGRAHRRLHGVFVVAEVALSVCLLFGSGLLIRSFIAARAVDPGYTYTDVLSMRLTLPWSKYEGPAIPDFFEHLAGSVEAIPGVVAATTASAPPSDTFIRRQFSREGDAPVTGDGQLPDAFVTIVASDYFETLEIPLLAGRVFDGRDVPGGAGVAVVNATMARRYFDDQAVGKRFKLGAPDGDGPMLEIIGVVADVKNRGVRQATAAEFYGSLQQFGASSNQHFLMVRTEAEPAAVTPAIREAVAAMDPEQPIYSIATLQQRLDDDLAVDRIAMRALGAFAVLALLLAAVGISGVVANAVGDRVREIGVRMALGADSGSVRTLIVRQALVPVVVGWIVGTALAIALGRGLASMLYEVGATDPAALAGTGAVLLGVALLASWLPARRASAIDPVRALRAE